MWKEQTRQYAMLATSAHCQPYKQSGFGRTQLFKKQWVKKKVSICFLAISAETTIFVVFPGVHENAASLFVFSHFFLSVCFVLFFFFVGLGSSEVAWRATSPDSQPCLFYLLLFCFVFSCFVFFVYFVHFVVCSVFWVCFCFWLFMFCLFVFLFLFVFLLFWLCLLLGFQFMNKNTVFSAFLVFFGVMLVPSCFCFPVFVLAFCCVVCFLIFNEVGMFYVCVCVCACVLSCLFQNTRLDSLLVWLLLSGSFLFVHFWIFVF